jgi:TolA-binding protein
MARAWALLATLLVAAGAAAQPASPPPVPGAQPAAAATAKKTKRTAIKRDVRPAWAELNTQQQQVLAPLKNDWDSLEVERRLKWIQIAKRYPRMKPLEQERVQRRMQIWANLSPEQRRQARENYKRLAKAARPAQKSLREQWAEYQALSQPERESLVPAPSIDPRRQKH